MLCNTTQLTREEGKSWKRLFTIEHKENHNSCHRNTWEAHLIWLLLYIKEESKLERLLAFIFVCYRANKGNHYFLCSVNRIIAKPIQYLIGKCWQQKNLNCEHKASKIPFNNKMKCEFKPLKLPHTVSLSVHEFLHVSLLGVFLHRTCCIFRF